MKETKLCSKDIEPSTDDHCESCFHKNGRCTELCDKCFHIKLEKIRIREEMEKRFKL